MAVEPRQVVEQPQPSLDHHDPPVLVRRQRELRDEARDVLEVAGRRGVVDRGLGSRVRLAPAGGAPVELGHEVGLPALELRAEKIADQAAIAIRPAIAIQRNDEQARAIEHLEPPRRVFPLEHRVADRGAHPLEHRGSQDEAPDGRREPGEVLGPEVVGDVAVVPAERPGVAAGAE